MIFGAVNLFHQADSFVLKVQVTVNLLLSCLLVNYLSACLFVYYRQDVVFFILLLPGFLVIFELGFVDKVDLEWRVVFQYFAKNVAYPTHYAITPLLMQSLPLLIRNTNSHVIIGLVSDEYKLRVTGGFEQKKKTIDRKGKYVFSFLFIFEPNVVFGDDQN